MTNKFLLAAASAVLVVAADPALGAKKKAAAAPAVAAPAAPERVTSVEGITEYRLANGLRVLLFPDPTKQTMTVNVTYLVGSRHENYGETGMAHLLEHLVFKGTPRHPDIPKELSEHGTRPNGTTSFDRTNYFETFNATEENLRWALDLEADRMVNSFIAKKDLDTEMTVVRNEFEAGENQPAQVLFKRIISTAYDWHNYGNLPIGARSDIENVPIDRLQAFYRNYYQPDNAILLVAGKIDEAATLAMVQQYFGVIPRPARTLPPLHTIEPTQDGEREVILRRTGDVQFAATHYHVPAGSHEDFAAIQILSQILGHTPSGRLHKQLVEPGKAAAVFNFSLQQQDPGGAFFAAQVRQEQPLAAARDILLSVVERPDATPVTDEEVERARTQLLKQIELNLNASDRVGLELSNWAGMGDWRLMFLHRDRLRAVKTADVQRVWANYFKPSNRTAGLFYPTKAPDRAEIPPKPDVLALVKDYQGDAAMAQGEAFEPSPANIDARTLRSQLPGGLKLALLPKKSRGGAVQASLGLQYGDEASLKNRREAANMASAMLMHGTKKRTRQQLTDEFDRLKARVNVNAQPGGVTVGVETTRENLPAVLTLLTEVLREPAFDAKEFEQLRAERLAALEQQRTDPTALAFNAMQRRLSPYDKADIRYNPTIDDAIATLKAVTVDDTRRFYNDFYGANTAQLAIVGDFDAAEITRLTGDLLGNWKSPKGYQRLPMVYLDAAAANDVIETPDKANAFFVAGLNLKVRDDDADYPALVLGNYMLGGGFLNSRLSTRIRQKEGVSYGVGSQLYASPLDAAGAFFAYAIYAPENGARVEKAFNEEVARVLAEDFTAEELTAAKSGWLQSRDVSRAQDGELARALAGYLYHDRTLAWDAELERKVAQLTAPQIRAALARHLQPAKFTVVKAGDFAKAAKKP